jgi:Ni,Fe-hydrogenase III component G
VEKKVDGAVVDRVLEALGDAVLERQDRTARQTFLAVRPSSLRAAARTLIEQFGARLVTATGVDVRDGIEILYHFSFDAEHMIVTLRVLAARPECQSESLGQDWPAAQWIEREMHDLLGVNFRGHPDMRRLILADDWPEGVHPLRRDFTNEKAE